MKIFLMILQICISLGLIAAVLLQSGHSAGVSGAIAGGAETFFGKKKGMDEFLSKISTVLAALFLILCLLIAVFYS